jgi:plastocyanin
MNTTVRLVAAVLTAVATATACGAEQQTTQTAETSVGPPAATISISNFTFDTPASVPAGATIAVKNSDPAEHSVTADSGNTFSVDIEAGETATFTAPSQPGTYPYHCSYHPAMHGTLVVK